MKALAAFSFILLLLGAAGASAAGTTVTLGASSLSFKQAISQCPGSLGTISFTLGHTRAAGLPGVSEQIDTTSAGVDTITFTGAGGKTATVVADGHAMTVTATSAVIKSTKTLACIDAL